jgi:hypothetical protein
MYEYIMLMFWKNVFGPLLGYFTEANRELKIFLTHFQYFYNKMHPFQGYFHSKNNFFVKIRPTTVNG